MLPRLHVWRTRDQLTRPVLPHRPTPSSLPLPLPLHVLQPSRPPLLEVMAKAAQLLQRPALPY